MKLVCAYGNIVETGYVWCKTCTRSCPPAQLSTIFDTGEQLEEFAILARLTILPMATLYRVQYQKKTYLLKVAHNTFSNQLKQEAKLLSQLAHPALPLLQSSADQRPYSKVSIQGQIHYYILLADIKGEFLDQHLQSGRPFIPDRAAFLVISLADVVAYVNVRGGKILTNLNPGNIIIREDKDGYLRPTLLDLMSAVSGGASAYGPAINIYQAPEVVSQQRCDGTADVYSLGAILYELLTNERILPDKLKEDHEIRAMVLSQEPVLLKQRRRELISGISDLVHHALQKHPLRRQPDVRTFAKGLRTLFGEVPVERTGLHIDRRIITAVIFMVIILLIVLIIILILPS